MANGSGPLRGSWLYLSFAVSVVLVKCHSIENPRIRSLESVGEFDYSKTPEFIDFQSVNLSLDYKNSSFPSSESQGSGNFHESWKKENEVDEENGVNGQDLSWKEHFHRKSWLSGWTGRKSEFSLTGMLGSVLSTFANFFYSLVTESKEDDFEDSNRVSYKDHQLMRIFPRTMAQVRELRSMKDDAMDDMQFWTLPVRNRSTDVLVSPDVVQEITDFLKRRNMDYQVLIPDLHEVILTQNPRTSKERRQDLVSSVGHSMTWRRYHRYADILGYIEYLVLKYPDLVTVETIGNSFHGLPLKVIKISTGKKKNGEPKPAIWIDAGMHAREWIATAVATYILNQLVEKSANYTRILDKADWMILPVANPDGYEYSHTDDRLWRKTRSNHADSGNDSRYTPSGFFHMITHYTKWFFGSCEGVDPNRNFNYHWGDEKISGSTNDPCHDTYGGPSPFSEPETKAIASYVLANRRIIRAFLTLHSYSQMLLLPWGFAKRRPSDYEDLMNVAMRASKAIAKIHGTEYKVGPAAELLYPTAGASDDWAKGIARIKYVYTIELRDRGAFGFLLPASQIVPTARETWAGIRVIARLVTANT